MFKAFNYKKKLKLERKGCACVPFLSPGLCFQMSTHLFHSCHPLSQPYCANQYQLLPLLNCVPVSVTLAWSTTSYLQSLCATSMKMTLGEVAASGGKKQNWVTNRGPGWILKSNIKAKGVREHAIRSYPHSMLFNCAIACLSFLAPFYVCSLITMSQSI